MNKTSKIKIRKKLTDDELDKLIEEATVDCYDEFECFSGLASMIEDNLEVPFSAKVVGEDVKVTGIIEEPGEVLAECERKDKKYTVDILNVEFILPVKGIEWIDAYKKWKGY